MADLLRFRGPFAFIYDPPFWFSFMQKAETYMQFFIADSVRDKKDPVGADTGVKLGDLV